MHFRSICLSGGGITGIAHVGLMKRLADSGLLAEIDTVVGTSAGAVVGVLFAIGMTPSEMYDALVRLDRGRVFQFVDVYKFILERGVNEGKLIDRIADIFDTFFTDFGLDDGTYFMAHLADMFLERGMDPRATFRDLYATTKKRLILTGTNVSTQRPEYFSLETSPDMRVLDAVRISMGMPFLLTSIWLNENCYVDGSFSEDYPIQHCLQDFTKRHPFSPTLFGVIGSCLNSNLSTSILDIRTFINNLLTASIKKNHSDDHTVHVTVNLASVEFNATTEKLRRAFDDGYDACSSYLSSLNQRGKRLINRRRSI